MSKMFDINEELNQIIFKYHLDRYYPQYRKRYEAERVLKHLMQDLAERGQKAVFIGVDETCVEILGHLAKGQENIRCFKWDVKDQQSLQEITDKIYDRIFLAIMEDKESVGEWLRNHGLKCECLYDIFEHEGIFFDMDFYRLNETDYTSWFEDSFPGKRGWRNIVPLELYFQRKQLKSLDNDVEKQAVLERCYFLALYMKNFILAEEVLESMQLNVDAICASWREIQVLHVRIIEALRARRQKDTILYWLDALSYENVGDMLYLTKMIDKSVSFTNAFTVTPSTFPTGKAIFCGKRQIDDRAYRIKKISTENSKLLSFFENHGYEFKAVSGYMRWFEAKHVSDCYHELYEPCSAILWDTLQNVLASERSAVVLAHALVEGHHPFLNSRMDDESVVSDKIRFPQGRKELDEQLAYYDKFWSDNTIRVYMSDHGQHEFRTRYHIWLNFYHPACTPRKINSLFSILDFEEIFRKWLETGDIVLREPPRDYVEIQDVDWYNKKTIRYLIENKGQLDMFRFGYKGVITQEHIYIRFRMGKEWLVRRDNMPFEPHLSFKTNDVCDEELLPLFRELTGEYPEEVKEDKKFKYSKYLYKLLDNYLKAGNRKIDLIEQQLKEFPDKSVAIRMGGEHSAELYTGLSEECKKKILCFIDRNEQCTCKMFKLPILSLEESKKAGAKAVLLSSFDHLQVLREEAKGYGEGLAIIDIYAYFEEHGINCRKNFYQEINLTDKDYEVGFPFDEE